MFFPTMQLIGHVQSSYNYLPVVFSDALMASKGVSKLAYEMKYEVPNVQCYLLKIFLR